ncbi:MAG TPA: YdcF family protein [Alphaproteobacteria bacterium]|nr:YdcF family protein [Alphaproteobacteria bacterium]
MRRVSSALFSRTTAFGLGMAIGLYAVGLVWFAEAIPRVPADRSETTDAIIVLTGGPLRLKEGFSLLVEARAKKMLVSGVARGVELNELLRVAGSPPLTVACCVELGYAADNTAGNADESRAWMAKEGFSSLRLVTSNYHMPRSVLEFRRAMPAVRIVPHPVLPETFKRDDWWAWRGTFTLVALEYNKYLLTLGRMAMTPGRRG